MHRLKMLREHVAASPTSDEVLQGKQTLTVVDNRTGKYQAIATSNFSLGKTYEFPIKNNTIDASDLEKVKDVDGEVTRYYDPGYKNTVNCVSNYFTTMRSNLNL